MKAKTVRKQNDFTEGPIVLPLLRFVGPVLFALFLQAMYGAVDLMIVGRYTESALQAAHVSAVSTGSQIMMTITSLISSLAMGMTVLIGEKIGQKKPEAGGKIAGSGILLFLVIGIFMTGLTVLFAGNLAGVMQSPPEAFDFTVDYIRICGAGSLVIIAYNLIGSIFRGIGDSATPLVTVMIACFCNIVGDYILVALCGMGARGAAIATVLAQFISVAASLLLIRKKNLPFRFSRECLKWDGGIVGRILLLGTPIALQDLLVGISFLVILAIVNSLGVIESAGVGVAEKVCGFIMLVPAAFMQSMSAFTAQNRGAGRNDRAVRGFAWAVLISAAFGAAMFFLSFFHGDLLSGIFAKDPLVIEASFQYLKAYAIDCLLTCFLFCFIGFFNGMEYTAFVMLQGIIGAFLVRVPVSFIMSRQVPVSLFRIGLATPCSSFLQILMCFGCFTFWMRRQKRK